MRYLILVFLICFLAGCLENDRPKPVITIGTIQVSAKEFEEAYQASYFSQAKENGRKTFLDVFIARKLMLREAERMRLDKDPEFVKDIQLFWEQSLLKRLLVEKGKEASFKIEIGDREAEDFYNAYKDTEFSGRSFAQTKDQIKALLVRQQQQKMINDWVNQMRRQTNVTVDYQTLQIFPDK